jgi:hypothetical protein
MSKDNRNQPQTPNSPDATGGDDDARLNSRGPSGARPDRLQDERSVTQSRVSNDDRLAMFRNQLFNSALPELPEIPGYHLCWLTTTNPRDSIIMRQRLGYELIKATEFPGFDLVTQKTGEYVGCIAVNEMLAAKLPLELYEMYMREAHHEAPNREEEKIADTLTQIQESARGVKAEVLVEKGSAEFGKNSAAPRFEH